MLVYIIFCVCLCSRVLYIKCEAKENLTVKIHSRDNCIVPPTHRFTQGSDVNLVILSDLFINYIWVRTLTTQEPGEAFVYLESKERKYSQLLTINKTIEGTWDFKFLHSKNNMDRNSSSRINYKGNNYIQAICKTEVIIDPVPAPDKTTMYIVIGAVVGVTGLAIIVAQTACILHLRAKAQKLNRHKHLSKKAEPTGNDSARYCSNPGQKMTKIVGPEDDNSRESVIYEAPNIELPDRAPILPPQPPAINTIPRTPRADHNIRIGHQPMLSATMNYTAQQSTFPRPKPTEINLANRPPLPLPNHEETYEVYEEMEPIEENTYEQPPVINTVPQKPVVPQKKIAPAQLLDVKLEAVKLRSTGKKPLVTPKPQSPQNNKVKPMNELEMAFRRRNNVAQAPEQMIASSSASNGPNPPAAVNSRLRGPLIPVPQTVQAADPAPVINTRLRGPPMHVSQPVQAVLEPPPVVNTRPRAQPVPIPVQEEIYSNEHLDSSDDEWTYEPLKPLKSYDPNIYHI